MSIGLVAYSFRVKERFSNNSFVNLDDIDGNDMLEFIHSFLQTWSNGRYYTNPRSIKAFTVISTNIDNGRRTISGHFLSGEGGTPSEIRNINNINTISYQKQVEDSECIPLYYLFYLPTRTSGILILEKFRHISVKKVLSDLIREAFNESFQGFTIQIEPLTQRRLLNMYLEQGAIKSITLSSFNSPQRRIEERFANNDREIESLATYEFTIRSRRNRNLGLFQSILSRIANGNANIDAVNNMVGINGFIANEISATFTVNGKQKTIRIDQPDEIDAIYDISSELENVNRHPEYEIINRIANNYLNALLNDE